MTRERFDAFVDRIEDRYRNRPPALRLRIGLLIAVGYAGFLFWLVLGQHHLLAGRAERLETVQRRLSRFEAAAAGAELERSVISAKDRFLPHGLADDLRGLQAVLVQVYDASMP